MEASPKGGLALDSVTGIRDGGDSGALIVPGEASASLLYDAVSYSGSASQMPPDGKLPDRVIYDFRHWIEIGSPLPVERDDAERLREARHGVQRPSNFWSFQPARVLSAPKVIDAAWPRRKIDHFVLRDLEQRDLHPSDEADRRTLIRRAYFDLIGLPPKVADVEAFVSDSAPNAYERLVEQLLASSQYGARWARHWLDVARYAEDNPTGESTCKSPRFPWCYRDWVIQSFNDDLPYHEFVRRQLAADLIDDLPPSEIAATGFLGLSPVYHKEPKLAADVISVIVADEWDERLDAVTRGFLGLTVACARCHDHKFDPISTEDYYALAGVLASTQLVEWPLVEATRRQAEKLTATREALVDVQLRISYAKQMRETALMKGEDPTAFEQRLAELEPRLRWLQERKLLNAPIANAVRDAGTWVNGTDSAWTTIEYRPREARDLPVFVRGNPSNPGKVVPRRFLTALSDGAPEVFGNGSGRLELAECIVGEAASLTARVIVNRVWGWHFGQALVRTPSDFGQMGERPSHPDLLNDLAARFIAIGWSLKWLHREIMLSATYRQSSTASAGARVGDPADGAELEIDPENRLLAQMNRRRLEPEVWRDAALSVARELDLSVGGPSRDLDDVNNLRRSVYGAVSRQQPADVLRLFDFPDAKVHSDQRILTTTPLQQLYLLNSAWLERRAEAVAQSALEATTGETPRDVVASVFRQVLQREPSEKEIAWSIEFVATQGATSQDGCFRLAHALLASNEFLYVD